MGRNRKKGRQQRRRREDRQRDDADITSDTPRPSLPGDDAFGLLGPAREQPSWVADIIKKKGAGPTEQENTHLKDVQPLGGLGVCDCTEPAPEVPLRLSGRAFDHIGRFMSGLSYRQNFLGFLMSDGGVLDLSSIHGNREGDDESVAGIVEEDTRLRRGGYDAVYLALFGSINLRNLTNFLETYESCASRGMQAYMITFNPPLEEGETRVRGEVCRLNPNIPGGPVEGMKKMLSAAGGIANELMACQQSLTKDYQSMPPMGSGFREILGRILQGHSDLVVEYVQRKIGDPAMSKAVREAVDYKTGEVMKSLNNDVKAQKAFGDVQREFITGVHTGTMFFILGQMFSGTNYLEHVNPVTGQGNQDFIYLEHERGQAERRTLSESVDMGDPAASEVVGRISSAAHGMQSDASLLRPLVNACVSAGGVSQGTLDSIEGNLPGLLRCAQHEGGADMPELSSFAVSRGRERELMFTQASDIFYGQDLAKPPASSGILGLLAEERFAGIRDDMDRVISNASGRSRQELSEPRLMWVHTMPLVEALRGRCTARHIDLMERSRMEGVQPADKTKAAMEASVYYGFKSSVDQLGLAGEGFLNMPTKEFLAELLT
ncbi:MAG: hypothetical protein GF416_02640 [Candidatus Altiarchaeales archaeon]|nr:hypothetical protein [Candidatus Altiarchaeales archaeon]MBD3416017.1 hypothetical protein [Candidatus Altiarchaeales archaeon]